jgi:hypothetical protein
MIMTDRCRIELVPDDDLAIKLVVYGCEDKMKKIKEKAGSFTSKWLDERIEQHEWHDTDEEKK